MQICSKCGVEIKEASEYCKKCGSRTSTFGAQIDEKKARVLSNEKRMIKNAIIIMSVVVAVLAGIGFYFVAGSGSSLFARTATASHPAVSAPVNALVTRENGEIKIPIADLGDRSVHYYVYHHENKNIKFFLLRDAEGGVRAALDACNSCYRAKLGYRQQGENVICNNCGMSFKYEDVGKLTGGCNPIPIPKKVKGELVVLKAKDLEAGAGYF